MTLGLTSPTKSSYNSTLHAFSALESVDMSPLGLTAETGLNTMPTQHFVFAVSCLAPAGGHTQDAFVSVGCFNWGKKIGGKKLWIFTNANLQRNISSVVQCGRRGVSILERRFQLLSLLREAMLPIHLIIPALTFMTFEQ